MPESTNNFRSVIINRNPPTGNLSLVHQTNFSHLISFALFHSYCSLYSCPRSVFCLTPCADTVIRKARTESGMNNCSSSAVLIISHHSFLRPCTSLLHARYLYPHAVASNATLLRWPEWERAINVKQTRHHDYTICSNGCLDYVIVNISINKRVDFFTRLDAATVVVGVARFLYDISVAVVGFSFFFIELSMCYNWNMSWRCVSVKAQANCKHISKFIR